MREYAQDSASDPAKVKELDKELKNFLLDFPYTEKDAVKPDIKATHDALDALRDYRIEQEKESQAINTTNIKTTAQDIREQLRATVSCLQGHHEKQDKSYSFNLGEMAKRLGIQFNDASDTNDGNKVPQEDHVNKPALEEASAPSTVPTKATGSSTVGPFAEETNTTTNTPKHRYNGTQGVRTNSLPKEADYIQQGAQLFAKAKGLETKGYLAVFSGVRDPSIPVMSRAGSSIPQSNPRLERAFPIFQDPKSNEETLFIPSMYSGNINDGISINFNPQTGEISNLKAAVIDKALARIQTPRLRASLAKKLFDYSSQTQTNPRSEYEFINFINALLSQEFGSDLTNPNAIQSFETINAIRIVKQLQLKKQQ